MGTYDLKVIARQAMLARGLQPDYPQAVFEQLETINDPAQPSKDCKDLRHFFWCSIDNNDSKDLDQLTYAEQNGEGYSIWIAIADVDSLIFKDSPIDHHAQVNTTTVYTPNAIFPMLPIKLSNDLTSLNEGEDRVAVVVNIEVDAAGNFQDSKIFKGWVHNHAKLTYSKVGAWLEMSGEIPEKVKALPALEKTLQLQHKAADLLRAKRFELGALHLETPEAVSLFDGARIVDIEPAVMNAAHHLIENFMIAANNAIANRLAQAKVSSLRRVVRVPKRWEKIVELAAEKGFSLPEEPDSKALDAFLEKMMKEEPVTFPDLSLSIVKLLGSGEYIVETPGTVPVGHFGLALRDYTHSTAPNRRYPDVITQRQLKRHLESQPSPYSNNELEKLAYHCTVQEDAAAKVQRQVQKSAAALLLSSHIGEVYGGIVTGASSKGVYARIFAPPAEGRIIEGGEKADVGDRVKVRLRGVDVERGFIDFQLVSNGGKPTEKESALADPSRV